MRVIFALLLTLIAGPLMAQEEAPKIRFDSEVKLVSDYVWRGVSKSDQGLAFQAKFGLLHQLGFGFRLFGSVDLGNEEADLKIDARVGYTGQLYGGLELEGGAQVYTYSGSEADTWLEYFLELRAPEFCLGVEFSSDVFSTSFVGKHYGFDYTPFVDVCESCSESFQLIMGGGYYDLDREVVQPPELLEVPPWVIQRTYWHWKAGFGVVTGRRFTVSLTYQDTEGGEEIYGTLADRRYVVTIGKEF